MNNPEIIIIRGIPGSGKTTIAKTDYPNHVLCEADQFFTDELGNYTFNYEKIKMSHKWCQDKALNALNAGNNVVVANTFTQRWEIDPYKKMGFPMKIIKAKGNYTSIHGVPQHIIDNMKERFED